MRPPRHRNKGVHNANATLTLGQVRFIKWLLRMDGATYVRVAKLAKTSKTTVARIARGESWKDVK
jgi:hypothetical protein